MSSLVDRPAESPINQPGCSAVARCRGVHVRPLWRSRRSAAIINPSAALMICAAAHRENFVMAVPKRRMSRSNTRSRRSQWKTEAVGLVSVSVGGRQRKVPRRLLKAARLGLIDFDKR